MINYKNINNRKSFPAKEFEKVWPFDHLLITELFSYGYRRFRY